MDRHASRITCLIMAVLVGLIALATAGLAGSWATLIVLPLLWLYATGVVFLGIAGVRAIRHQSPPSLPFGSRALRGPPLLVLLGLVVAFTVAREAGAFSLSASSTHSTWHTNSSSGSSIASMNGARVPRMAGAAVSCIVGCDSDTACEAFARRLNCREPAADTAIDHVDLYIRGHIEQPTCFLPLYKRGHWNALVDVQVTPVFEGGSGGVSMSIQIDGETTTTGFESCHGYLERIGNTAADQVTQTVNQYLAQH